MKFINFLMLLPFVLGECPPSVICKENETFCPGLKDSDGCPTRAFCIETSHCGAEYTFCPPTCPEPEIVCPLLQFDADFCTRKPACTDGGMCL